MAEMFGISVIDDSQAERQSDRIGVGITAIVRIKHAALYEASKVMGSAAALARHLGVRQNEIGDWINLKACPPREAGGPLSSWTDERIAVMEAKLMELTGKTWEELWPDDLRENNEFLKSRKSIEKVFSWRHEAMLHYAAATRNRLESANANNESEESEFVECKKDAIKKCLHLLSSRERKIIERRYGIDGEPGTYDQLGSEFGVTRERVRQIEINAVAKLKRHSAMYLESSPTP